LTPHRHLKKKSLAKVKSLPKKYLLSVDALLLLYL
jgi:hypothetical protein